MTRGRANWLLLALATGLVALAIWQLRRPAPPVAAVPQRSDYVLRDFELTTLNDQGKESFTVTGPYLERDPAGRTLALTEPRFSFPDDDGGRWEAESASAWVGPKAEEVRLVDRVRLVGPPTPAGVRTRFSTEWLVVFPKRDQAETDRRVTVEQGDSILAGTGLRADMKAKRFQLLDQVKGRHAPRRR